MPEGNIILVRHGETEANRAGRFAESDDVALTEVGREEAHQVAQSIQAIYRPTKVLSSPFLRARETAEIVSGDLKISYETIDGVQERNFGTLKGEAYARMGRMMRADPEYSSGKRWLWAPLNGESLEQVRIRAVNALCTIARRYPTEQVVVVSHGAVMEAVTAHVSNNWEAASVPPNCGILLLMHRQLLTNSA